MKNKYITSEERKLLSILRTREQKEESYFTSKVVKLKQCRNPKLILSETFAKWKLERLGFETQKISICSS